MTTFQEADERRIIEKCQAHCQEYQRSSGIVACNVADKSYMVKFGPSTRKYTAARIANQRYLSSASQNADKIRVPNIVHEFTNESERGVKTTCLVTEFIDLVEFPPSDKDTRIENAVRWLATVAPPQDHKLGPLGGGYIVHRFFKEYEADLVFHDVRALERYVEKGRKRLCRLETITRHVELTDEPIICVQGDMDESHFGFDQEGNIVVMGLRSISFLPHSFGKYALQAAGGHYGRLPNQFGWLGETNGLTMATVASVLAMTGDTTLGRDEYGEEKKRRRG
ncbi:hypothetical protein FB45DRAFT_977145 [Roridomyces roridus]|uniref:Aminoglycoside phosphotransferase domain-containing protein n=1 Tax=Roridomyces roridus TaxID=1738132 RepID=A0AAD7C588_9AGAR|nr:hypothetical protein FB45DRAFT_977145 [Roridomyces roridus]